MCKMHISQFTLSIYCTQQALGDKHLLCCSGSQTDSTLSTSTNEVKDECCKDMERNNDIEKGNSDVALVHNGGDIAQDSKSTAACDDVAAIEYTHISIPMPGCEMTGIDHISSIEAAKGSRQEGRRWKLLSLFQSGKDEESDRSQTQTEPDKPNNSQLQTVEKRSVPIFCAICLSEFEKGDRVCWSSNANCSHVFHEDCILQWLMSSGKKISMNQYFTKHPTDAKLLENAFCPCCRQEFICVKPPSLLGSEEHV